MARRSRQRVGGTILGVLLWTIGSAGAGEIDVDSYRFSLTLEDESDRIEGEAEIRLRHLDAEVGPFLLDLIGLDEDGRGMVVTEVTDGSGQELSFVQSARRLEIDPPAGTVAGSVAAYRIRYSGEPADGLVIGRNLYGERTFFADNWPQRARHWLPTVDHPSDKAFCEFLVVAPDHYQVVANGRLVEETDLGPGRRLTHWRTMAPIPTKVMVIGVARFAVSYSEGVDGIELQSWVYPRDREAGFFDFSRAERILRFFVERLGPFPYAKLANVQATTRFGGMENAGAIFYRESGLDGSGANEGLVAHEIAHQWFGDSVTEATWSDLWLSEGFATYLATLYLEHTYGRDLLERQMAAGRARLLEYLDEVPAAVVLEPGEPEPRRLLSPNTYQKGAWVLHMLRRELGEEDFWKALVSFSSRYRHSVAGSADFRRVVEEVSGRDLGWFFEQWLERPGMPRLRGDWEYDPDLDLLEVRLRQEQAGQPYRLVIDLEVRTENGNGSGPPVGNTMRAALGLDAKEGAARLVLPGAPRSVRIDPDGWLLFEGGLERPAAPVAGR